MHESTTTTIAEPCVAARLLLSASPGATGKSSLSILFVEDDEVLLDSTASAMTSMGHRVLRATDATQAVALLKAHAVDVLMTDINLPGMSGEILAAEARALCPQIQLMFVTGRSDIRGPMAGGLDPHLLRKPFTFAVLEKLLESLPR